MFMFKRFKLTRRINYEIDPKIAQNDFGRDRSHDLICMKNGPFRKEKNKCDIIAYNV